MKKILIGLIAAAMVCSLAACGGSNSSASASSAKSEPAAASSAASSAASASTASASADSGSADAATDVSDLRLCCTLMTMENPYFVDVAAGFQDRCAELGIECNVVDGDYDAATQYSVVENFIASGYDGCLLSAVDGDGISPLVKQAYEDQGMIFLGEAQAVEAAYGNYIIYDYNYGYNIGLCAAAWINEKLDGKGNVLLITEDNVKSVKLRGDGMVDAITENCPDANIVMRQSGCEPDQAMATTEAALQAHPEINVICCNNDSGAIGAYEAVKAIVPDTSNFYLGGADATAEGLAKMQEDGSFFRCTVDILPYETGYNAVDMLVDYIVNGTPGGVTYFDQEPVWQEGHEDLANVYEFRTSTDDNFK